MGRKKIEKAPKPEKVESESEAENAEQVPAEEPEVQTKGAKGKRGAKQAQASAVKKAQSNSNEDVELFSDKFNSSVNEFRNFYRDFLNLRASHGGSEQTGELSKVTEELRDKIQEATLNVLREDLQSAQKWLNEQQESIRKQISQVDKTEADVRKSYEQSGSFSAEQINSNVEGIRSKRAGLQSNLDELQKIKQRSIQIHQSQSSKMDIESD